MVLVILPLLVLAAPIDLVFTAKSTHPPPQTDRNRFSTANVLVDRIAVDPGSGYFVDTSGRARLFHGVNAVEKVHPFLPPMAPIDTSRSLGDADAAQIASWGMNVVRLGVLWQAVAPVSADPATYNTSYLGSVKNTIEMLARHGIWTIVDMHQDVLGAQFCGEGLPSWAMQKALAIAGQSSSFEPFPAPKNWDLGINTTTGLPDGKLCKTHPFSNYYSTDAVAATLSALFASAELNDDFAAHWGAVAKALVGVPGVLGYELLNEPFNGDPFASDAKELLPMYVKAAAAIRAYDNETIVMYEPHVTRAPAGIPTDFPPGGPGGAAYDDRQALAYHVYCFNTTSYIALPICKLAIDLAWGASVKGLKSTGGGGFLTEFGAVGDDPVSLVLLEFVLSAAESQQQSWAYWTYKSFDDITTANLHSETLFNSDGTIQQPKLVKLTRPYASTIAGTPLSQHFDPKTSTFTMAWRATPLASRALTNTTTLVFASALHYPDGVAVQLAPTSGASWRALGSWIAVETAGLASGAEVTLVLTPKP